VAGAIHDLAWAVDMAVEARVDESLVSQARVRLRELLIAWSDHLAPSPAEEVAQIAPLVDLLIDLRSQARAARDWALADEVRDRLAALGIVLEDGRDQTTWKRG
jgi:cysteinyl-tRNA synthetase